MNIQEALAFIEKYCEGETNTYNGHREWEIRQMPESDGKYPGMYEVRCYEPLKVGGGGTENILWADGYSSPSSDPWWLRRPDFKQAYLTKEQVILLAIDLMVELDEDKETNDE